MATININDVLTTAEVATLAGISTDGVKRAAQNKRIAATKVGHQWLIKRKDAERFAASIRRPGRKPKK